MRIDLMAGLMVGATHAAAASEPTADPTILVFDSGLGGLTVLEQVRRARPDAHLVYVADDAAFPYGALDAETLVGRVSAVIGRLIDLHAPDLVVIACNTASTLVLPALRTAFATPFVGVVPPIKPAAALSRSRVVSLLATPGTVARPYTRELVEAYAADCAVTLVGAPNLARFAEAEMAGDPPDDARLAAEIAPCFVALADGRRTDVVCLSCTHYPLLLPRFERLAPWPVAWVDPAPAIARRILHLLGPCPWTGTTDAARPVLGIFTGGQGPVPALRRSLAAHGLAEITVEPMPLAR